MNGVGADTPVLTQLARQGRWFQQAYAAVPETLPSHTSMLTGLYPGGHGVHENGRFVADAHPVLADQLRQSGYRTAAVVSAYVLARRFGLARGFDEYDDGLGPGVSERSAGETTDRALALVSRTSADRPLFLWVHYFDAHAPYAPPEPFKSRFADDPYRGEVAYVDAQMGRLLEGFRAHAATAGRPVAIVVAADHGEGRGDHGEAGHGNLVYQSTMHVPLAVVGPGVSSGVVETPVSTRRIFHTILDWAGRASPDSLRAEQVRAEVVLGEAMKPYLQYGWQPQIMAVDGPQKAILSGRVEVFDVLKDPGETKDLGIAATLPVPLRQALDEYPVPSLAAASAPGPMDAEAREKLASLGYVSATTAPVVRRDAPRPVDMAHLFDVIDRASTLFVQERWTEVIPVLRQILAADPNHLDATMRLATAYSSTGQQAAALDAFRRAAALAPESPDVPLYLALHYTRGRDWAKAEPLLERVLAASPQRVPALEGLIVVRERQGRLADVLSLQRRLFDLRPPSGAEALRYARLAMGQQQTSQAVWGFEQARAAQGAFFGAWLELGVVYQAAGRLPEAGQALDRVPAGTPDTAMARFKRAQVAVMLREPDAAARIAAARQVADAVTRPLIARERLFAGR